MLQGFAETAALTVAAYDSPSKRLIARLMWVNFIYGTGLGVAFFPFAGLI